MLTARHTVALALTLSARALAGPAADLPIREVTAFKDGHALVLRTGRVPVDERGDVVLTELPRPVMGAFWAQGHEPGARLAAVTASRAPVTRTRPVGTVEDLLRANIGRSIVFDTPGPVERAGVLLDVVEHHPPAPATPDPFWNGYAWHTFQPSPQPPAQRLALVRTDDHVAALPISEISNLRFEGGVPETELSEEVQTERLTLDLVWLPDPGAQAEVSLMYLQRGLRWIPSYRVTILDGQTVRIELQTTLVNELADLEHATVHMAVGVPSFAFEHTPDPMGLRERLDRLGLFFSASDPNQTAAMLSNAVMSQVGPRRDSHAPGAGDAPEAAGPGGLAEGERAEDLFVFTLNGVTLAKGARMVVPLVTYEAPYRSVYTLQLPAAPPAAALRQFSTDQQRELARHLGRPVARHVLRIRNESPHDWPITTAPAMVVRHGRVLAQGLMAYTPAGAEAELEVGAALDIEVSLTERETGRELDALAWNGHRFARVETAWHARLTNRKTHPVTIEVCKLALGTPGSVRGGERASSAGVGVFSDDASRAWPGHAWWNWYGWPYWWHRLNGAARFDWTVTIEPGEGADLHAEWRYLTE